MNFIPLHKLDRDTTRIPENLNLYKEFKSIYAELKPDLILHYTSKPIIFGGRAAHKLGIKSIAVVTGLGYAFIRKGWLNTITRYLYKKAANYHQEFIFENEDDLALFKKGFLGNNKGISIKGCGVDPEYFKPEDSDEDTEKSTKTTFTFIGRLLKDKGIREFVAAAKKVEQEINFKIVGDLDEENPSQISKQQLVDWLGNENLQYIDFKEDIRPEIKQASCVVLPSYREGMPRTILEAMSMEKPVIVTDVPGCRETVIDGENGFICKPKDPEDLFKTMMKFLELDTKAREIMGKKGRKMILSSFTSDQIANQILESIQKHL